MTIRTDWIQDAGTHTGYYLRPTLQEAVSGWLSLGMSKLASAQVIIKMRLSGQNSQGHGNRAAKRFARMEAAKWFDEVEAEFLAQDPEAFPIAYAKGKKLNYHDL